MKNKKLYLSLISIFVITLIVGVFALSQNNQPAEVVGSSITYGSDVCIQTIRADGTRETPECSSNLLYDTGKDIIRDYIGDSGGTGDEVDIIALCNATSVGGVGCGVPQADASEGFTILKFCGLANVSGTYSPNVEAGNWTIWHEFTSTCDAVTINSTRLRNTAGINFAGNNFTSTILQNLDRILVNWTIYVL